MATAGPAEREGGVAGRDTWGLASFLPPPPAVPGARGRERSATARRSRRAHRAPKPAKQDGVDASARERCAGNAAGVGRGEDPPLDELAAGRVRESVPRAAGAGVPVARAAHRGAAGGDPGADPAVAGTLAEGPAC